MDFKPVLMHYHMYPGGVSTLILNTIILLIERGYIKDNITFVLGTEEKSEWFFKKLKESIKQKVNIDLKIIPEINYWDDSFGEVEQVADKVKELFKQIGSNGRVLWAQNPTLGKNPAYTLALKKLAQEKPDQKIWMHVHDSAEQGRWPNLDLMYSRLSEPYYFDAPGTRWMVINRIDYRAYLEAGMPEEHLFYVPDPLLLPVHQRKKGKAEIGEVLSGYAAKNGFTFNGDLPWLLFAGRTIRRKNLLETLLIALCAPKKLTFLVTLPADSPDDKPYEEMLFNAIRKYRLGAAGFGIHHVGTDFALNDLALAADLVISSSVMEGFGLPYLEFPMLGRPVMAKEIYIMEDFTDIRKGLPHHYYQELLVPVPKNIREIQLARYKKKVETLGSHFNILESKREKVSEFFSSHFAKESVSFSFLSASQQIDFIENIDNGKIGQIQQLNKDIFECLDTGFKDQDQDAAKVANTIDSAFGAEVYAKNVEKMLSSYGKKSSPRFDPNDFSRKFLSIYFTPQNLRLLLDYKPFIGGKST
jgi:glycosyltransferase involved in cell wall biosynthesis